MGGLLLLGGNGGVVLAEQTVASGLAALAVATVPLWSALFAGLLGEWPRRLEWAGLGIGLAGIVLLNLHGSLRSTPGGAALLVLATVSWAFGSMWSRRLDMPSGLMAPAAEMLAGGVLLFVAGLLRGEHVPRTAPMWPLLAVAYLVVFGSLVGYCAYIWLLQNVRPMVATSYAFVNPVIAMVLGVSFAHENLTATDWVALPIVLAGVALALLGGQQRKQAGTQPSGS